MALIDNVVAAWHLNEASGSRADSHGSNTLTDNNTVLSATGILGDAAQFVLANSEFLSLTDNADLSTGNIDFTFQAWIYFDSLGGGNPHHVLAKDNDVGGGEYALWFENGVGLRWGIAGNAVVVTSSASISTATWYHVVAWHDATNDEIGLAVNAGTPSTNTTGGTAPSDTTVEFRIGARAVDGFYFDGRIDETIRWNRVLTSQERTDLYNGGAGFAYPFSAAAAPRMGYIPRRVVSRPRPFAPGLAR